MQDQLLYSFNKQFGHFEKGWTCYCGRLGWNIAPKLYIVCTYNYQRIVGTFIYQRRIQEGGQKPISYLKQGLCPLWDFFFIRDVFREEHMTDCPLSYRSVRNFYSPLILIRIKRSTLFFASASIIYPYYKWP